MEAKVTKTLTLVLSESDCEELKILLAEFDELWDRSQGEMRKSYKGSILGELWTHL
jgi:hypothetical protein